MSEDQRVLRYVMRPGDYGFWTIVDVATEVPVSINGVVQTTIDVEQADKIVDMLNGEALDETTAFVRSH